MSQSFQVQFENIIDDLTDDVHKVAEESKKAVGKETTKMLRSTSPRSDSATRRGRYAKGWRWREEYGEVVVYNQTDWQLTHLLADGHKIYNRFGGPFGDTSANSHIDDAAAFAGRELPLRISRGLK